MNTNDEKLFVDILNCLEGSQLNEVLLEVWRHAIVMRLFNDDQRDTMDQLVLGGDRDELEDFIGGEVSRIVQSLIPTCDSYNFLNFFDGWHEDLFHEFFPDGPESVIFSRPAGDRVTAKELAERARHFAWVHDFQEEPSYGTDEYLGFLTHWRGNVLTKIRES